MLRFSLVFVCILVAISAQDKPQKSCRAVFSDMNRKQLTWINRCVKELGYKTGREKTQKSTCVMKCVLNNLDMLNAEGNLNQAQFDTYIQEQYPAHMHERANKTFQPCIKISGDISQTDEFCKGYDPLVKCLTRNFANLCRGA